MSRRALVVSLHDVSPQTDAASARILSELEQLGVRTASLLVIPNHHGKGQFLEDQALCSWLREVAANGHEIVAHGYYHQRAKRERENVREKITTRVYTAGEGEFYDLDSAGAGALLIKARAAFAQIGVAPMGFIAPAWLLSDGAQTALREGGWTYTTRLGSVLDLETGREHRSQSLVWSVRSAWRRIVSLAWNAVLFRAMRDVELLRISIHPVDLEHPLIWRQIRALVRQALVDREPLSYGSWLARKRTIREVPG